LWRVRGGLLYVVSEKLINFEVVNISTMGKQEQGTYDNNMGGVGLRDGVHFFKDMNEAELEGIVFLYSKKDSEGQEEIRSNILAFRDQEFKLAEQGLRGKFALFYKGKLFGVADTSLELVERLDKEEGGYEGHKNRYYINSLGVIKEPVDMARYLP